MRVKLDVDFILVEVMTLRDLIDNRYTDKDTLHSYIDVYQELLEPISESATRVLEVGIEKGGSIKLWSEFFPNAQIYGIDVILYNIEVDLSSPRITCFATNAYDREFVKSLGYGTFDFVIDDGPHSKESMIFFAEEYVKLLKPGGVLVIEDIQSTDWVKDILMALPDTLRNIAVVHDHRSLKNRYDDIFITLRLPI
jgi:predicted O-methyltransferase YrrM